MDRLCVALWWWFVAILVAVPARIDCVLPCFSFPLPRVWMLPFSATTPSAATGAARSLACRARVDALAHGGDIEGWGRQAQCRGGPVWARRVAISVIWCSHGLGERVMVPLPGLSWIVS